MLKHLALAAALALGVGLTGCQNEPATGPSGTTASTENPKQAELPKKAEDAVEIARYVQNNPQGIDEVLREKGMTRQDFDDLMYDVAKDPDMTRQYLDARKRD